MVRDFAGGQVNINELRARLASTFIKISHTFRITILASVQLRAISGW
jgi:hypothetical protein